MAGRPRRSMENTGPTVKVGIWYGMTHRDEPSFSLDGKTADIEDVAERFGVTPHAIRSRARRGMPPEVWLLQPDAFKRWSDDQRRVA